MTLPNGMLTGIVYGEFLEIISDREGAAEDLDAKPDGVPMRGIITFTPETSEPVLFQGVTCHIKNTSVNLVEGAFNVELVSNSGFSPVWYWRAIIRLEGEPIESFLFDLPNSTSLNISEIVHIPE